VIAMEALSREFRVALPWELLYADDLVVIAKTEDDCDEVICRGCVNPVTGTRCTNVDIGDSANLQLVDKFCYLAMC